MSGVSCVSHDAVRSVPGPRALPASRATMELLNVFVGSSLRIVLAPIAPFIVPTMYVLGVYFCLTYPNSLVPRCVSFMGSLS